MAIDALGGAAVEAGRGVAAGVRARRALSSFHSQIPNATLITANARTLRRGRPRFAFRVTGGAAATEVAAAGGVGLTTGGSTGGGATGGGATCRGATAGGATESGRFSRSKPECASCASAKRSRGSRIVQRANHASNRRGSTPARPSARARSDAATSGSLRISRSSSLDGAPSLDACAQ